MPRLSLVLPLFTLLLALPRGPASAEAPPASARIVEVTRVIGPRAVEVVLDVTVGTLPNASPVWLRVTGGAPVRGTITLPDGLPDIRVRQRVMRVQLAFEADVTVAAGLELASSPAPLAAAPARRPVADLLPCPFTPAELQAALGPAFKPGVGEPRDFGTGVDIHCAYHGPRLGDPAVHVYQTAMKDGSPTRTLDRYKAGSMESIPGDPDGASWQVGQGDLEAVSLSYNRAEIAFTVRFQPGSEVLKDPPRLRDARQRVLRLARLPRYR